MLIRNVFSPLALSLCCSYHEHIPCHRTNDGHITHFSSYFFFAYTLRTSSTCFHKSQLNRTFCIVRYMSFICAVQCVRVVHSTVWCWCYFENSLNGFHPFGHILTGSELKWLWFHNNCMNHLPHRRTMGVFCYCNLFLLLWIIVTSLPQAYSAGNDRFPIRICIGLACNGLFRSVFYHFKRSISLVEFDSAAVVA